MTPETSKSRTVQRTRVPPPGFRTSLRARLRLSALIGIAILGAWLAYTVNTVLALYGVTLTIQRTTDLRERVQDALAGLAEAQEALDRYVVSGQGYDLSRHNSGRTTLHMALGAISRRVLTESSRGLVQRAEVAEEIYATTADSALKAFRVEDPSGARALRDSSVDADGREAPRRAGRAAGRLHADRIARRGAVEEQPGRRRDGSRPAGGPDPRGDPVAPLGPEPARADPHRRGGQGAGDLAADRTPPRLFDQSDDEIGELGRNFNQAAEAPRGALARARRARHPGVGQRRAGGGRDRQRPGRLRVQGPPRDPPRLRRVERRSLPSQPRRRLPAGRVARRRRGGERRWAARKPGARRRSAAPLFLSVEPATPTINVYDGRILPRESRHHPARLLRSRGRRSRARRGAGLHGARPQRPLGDRAVARGGRRQRVGQRAGRRAVAAAGRAERAARGAEEPHRPHGPRAPAGLRAEGPVPRLGLPRAAHAHDRHPRLHRSAPARRAGAADAAAEGEPGARPAQRPDAAEAHQRRPRHLPIEAGKMEIAPQRVEVATVLRQVEADFTDAAARKGTEADGERGAGALAGHDRSGQADADPRQPRRQLAEVHRHRLHRHRRRAPRRRALGAHRLGHGHRHSRGGAGSDLRGVPPGRARGAPGARRHRAGPRHLSQARARARRNDLARELPGEGIAVHRPASPRAGTRNTPGPAGGSDRAGRAAARPEDAFSSWTTTRGSASSSPSS